MVYSEKFSDDTFLKTLIPRLSENDIHEIFELISRLLKTHLKEEYHKSRLTDIIVGQNFNDYFH